jgi:hypothetical protein
MSGRPQLAPHSPIRKALKRTDLRSMSAVARKAGISVAMACRLSTGQERPRGWDGLYKQSATALAAAMGFEPNELFPPEREDAIDPAQLTALVEERQTYKPDPFQGIGLALGEAMADLAAREVAVLYARFWEDKTLAETCTELGVTRERIRQIEAKALRKLRCPERVKYLMGMLEGCDTPYVRIDD